MGVPDSKNDGPGLLLKGRQVLVVEDDSDTREMLKFVLERNGADVIAVSAVEPALDAFQRVRPDTVVADIGMPEYNGYALIARIRELDRQRQSQTRCVAVTAYATTIDRDTTLKAGYDAYIAKPFVPEELVNTVVALARKQEPIQMRRDAL